MFKNKDEENYDYAEENVETVIGSSVKLEGDLIGQESINVHGEVNGKIETKGNVSVGDNALIKADVNATNVMVAGTVEGNINALEKLEVSENGRILGDITCASLSIAPGACLSGQCAMQNSASEAKEEEQTEDVEE